MTEFLDDFIGAARSAVEHRFFFRKLGLPFDYSSDPDDFPNKCFANAREAKAASPNFQGFGGGYALSCQNHSLLFDGYLLRLETGIGTNSDEQILDRLIGGFIRLATVAPKAFLVRGVAADGRGFFSGTSWDVHAAWAFALGRGAETPAIAPESQEKFQSIAAKWIERLDRERFDPRTVDNKQIPANDMLPADPWIGPVLLGLLMAAFKATRDEKWRLKYVELADAEARARLRPLSRRMELGDLSGWMWRQAMLSTVARFDDDEARKALAREGMRAAAAAAAEFVGSWRDWTADLEDVKADLEWRNRPKVQTEGLPTEENPKFAPPESWSRLFRESATIRRSLEALYIILLAGDGKMAEPFVEDMNALARSVSWRKIVTLAAVAPLIPVHARGVELGLWDGELYGALRSSSSDERSIVAKYLEPGYDRDNPDKAGHTSSPSQKRSGENGKGGDGRRRRRRRH